MTRVVIHAGFHKTGTTSVQTMLQANRERLAPHLRVFLKDDFETLTKAARAYSAAPSDAALNRVGSNAAKVFRALDPADPRPVLMSSEDLSGHIPGRHGIARYSAAPQVMARIAGAVFGQFGADTALTFYFSTREAPAWLRSAWWQNLRSTRLTEDAADYARTLAPAADLDTIVAEVATAVPRAAVRSVPLETSRALPEGPLSPLLDLAGIDPELRDSLDRLPPANAEPEIGLAEVFLALNRSGLNDRNLRNGKKLLRQMANRQAGRGRL